MSTADTCIRSLIASASHALDALETCGDRDVEEVANVARHIIDRIVDVRSNASS